VAAETKEQAASTKAALGFASAFAASASYAISLSLGRHGVSEDMSPILGSLVALIFGTVGFTLLAGRSLRTPAIDFRRGALFFGLAGLFSTIGVVGQFLAVEQGQVVLVAPIANTYPLFTLIIGAIVLRHVERLTSGVFAGAILVVVGVIVLTLG
jgi:drug/metabolite transporter, DME family